MKKTLLALMLVSSLFVISCGADATKPEDLQAKSYESKTGTATVQQITANANTPIDAATIYNGITTGTYDSVKITKIVSIKSQDTTTGQYTTDVTFTENKNAAEDIVLSVTPTVTAATTVAIVYQYKIDTFPTTTVDFSNVKPTLEAEIAYDSAAHSTTGITVNDAALSLGKRVFYKLYSKNIMTEPTAKEATITEGSITLPITTLGTLADGDKVYYKIWVY